MNNLSRIFSKNKKKNKCLDCFVKQNNESRSHSNKDEGREGGEIPIKLAFSILIIWILISGSIFYLFEDWSMFECIYFFFISLTTIGIQFFNYTFFSK